MQIGFDASRAVQGRRTGTEHYSARLLQALSRLERAVQHSFSCYVNSEIGHDALELFGFALPANFTVRHIPFRRAWTHARLGLEMIQHPPDVLFVPSHVVPLWHPPHNVVTIHDVGYLYYPEAHTRLSRFYLHLSTWWSTRAAQRVIAISRATADDLKRFYKVPEEKLRVVWHGCDPTFRPVYDRAEQARVREKYQLPLDRPYILYVGTLQPRKNLGRLVEAYVAGLKEQRLGQPDPVLVLAGKHGWLYDSLFAQVKELGLEDHVLFPDYVEQADLPTLISGAAAFALPSLYEGFGMPALEAMACGTPLVAAKASSLPEIVGDAGLLVDPNDTAAWAAALQAVLNDPALRVRLQGAGMARVVQFTWPRAATETLRVLEEAGPELYRHRGRRPAR
jgi:glycosyltransferase involved in cell wall biosynthesis